MSKAGVSAVVAACGTVTVAAGCGGSASAAPCRPDRSSGTVVAAYAPRHLSVVGAAAAKTQQAGSARISMRTSGTTTTSIDMTGVTDFVHHRALSELTFNAAGNTFGGQMRVFGHCEYIEAVAFDSQIPTKKPWVSIDFDKLLPGLTGASATAANDSLKELEQVGTFHRIGPARVRGVETALYDGTISAATIAAKLPSRLRDALKKEHVTSIPTRVWIDLPTSAGSPSRSTACSSASSTTTSASRCT